MVRSPAGSRCAGAAAAVIADLVLGEPPSRIHPVALFGSGMGTLERRCWRDSRLAGAQFTAAGMVISLAAGGTLAWFTGRAVRSQARPSWLGTVLACTVAGTLTTAGRALGDEALRVRDLLASGDMEHARESLPALVGRDTAHLDEKESVRAVVESVAENTVDAIVAPVLWAVAFGAPGTFAYRALNTLDSMVGHRNQQYSRFGWASARADDIANWLPARLTALLVVTARPGSASGVWRAVRGGAHLHPSPNAGVAEAAFAGALGVRLGGDSTYEGRFEHRPVLGYGRPPEMSDIQRAVRLSRDASLVLCAALVCAALVCAALASAASAAGRTTGATVRRPRRAE